MLDYFSMKQNIYLTLSNCCYNKLLYYKEKQNDYSCSKEFNSAWVGGDNANMKHFRLLLSLISNSDFS